MDKQYVLTLKGKRKLEKELAFREGEKRQKLTKVLGETRDAGDVSENEGFEIANDDFAANEGRIAEIKLILDTAQIVEKDDGETATIGDTVTVKVDNKTVKFEIVGENESDPLNNKISFNSPIGSALLNKKKGDKVTIKLPKGDTIYEILDVE